MVLNRFPDVRLIFARSSCSKGVIPLNNDKLTICHIHSLYYTTYCFYWWLVCACEEPSWGHLIKQMTVWRASFTLNAHSRTGTLTSGLNIKNHRSPGFFWHRHLPLLLYDSQQAASPMWNLRWRTVPPVTLHISCSWLSCRHQGWRSKTSGPCRSSSACFPTCSSAPRCLTRWSPSRRTPAGASWSRSATRWRRSIASPKTTTAKSSEWCCKQNLIAPGDNGNLLALFTLL